MTLTKPLADFMSEPSKTSDTMIVTLTVGELREIVLEAVKAGTGLNGRPDHLLDIDEAAKLLSVSPDWLYHNRKSLPFARKLGRKMLRFSYYGLVRWMEAKKFS